MIETTYISDINAVLSANVPYWDKFGRYLVIFTLVIAGKALARVLVRTIKGDKKEAAKHKETEAAKKQE